jgi:hypothetical protein
MTHGVFLWGLAFALAACANPVKETQRALQEGRALEAFRLAHSALAQAGPEEQEKQLRAVRMQAARALLAAPDPPNVGEALELVDALPPGSEESEKAAQRALRVMAPIEPPAALDQALQKLGPGMGDETAVRSNLRAIVDANLGTASAVWAANVVVTRWPESHDRWMDLARAQMATGAFVDAGRSLGMAEQKLSAFCRELPARMAAYDPVRRKSAYGEYESRRCGLFAQILAGVWAAASGKTALDGVTLEQKEATAPAFGPCPEPQAMHAEALSAASPAAVMLSPRNGRWWLDGRVVEGMAASATPGNHAFAWESNGRCHSITVTVAPQTALVLRTESPRP